MLTSDLARVRRRGDRISAAELTARQRERLLPAAERYTRAAKRSVGKTREQFETDCGEAPADPTDYKIVKGLRKLVEDRCAFETQSAADPLELRRAAFARAARLRRMLDAPERFDADAVLKAEAARLQLSEEETRFALFADLKENQVLTSFRSIGAVGLLDAYDMSLKQAVLLRAARVSIDFRKPAPGGVRHFFRALKFRRLLYAAERLPAGGFRVEIDGPFSLFRLSSAYGLQLALLLPALDECGPWTLEAEILWKPRPKPYRFQLEGGNEEADAENVDRLSDDLELLKTRFEKLGSRWEVETARDLLDVPGVGVCVPDLSFRRKRSKYRVFFESLGYWSRDAVWKRAELASAGLAEPALFAVSSRLRVSEEILDDDLPRPAAGL